MSRFFKIATVAAAVLSYIYATNDLPRCTESAVDQFCGAGNTCCTSKVGFACCNGIQDAVCCNDGTCCGKDYSCVTNDPKITNTTNTYMCSLNTPTPTPTNTTSNNFQSTKLLERFEALLALQDQN